MQQFDEPQNKINQFSDRLLKSLKPKTNQIKPYDKRERSGEGFAVTVFPSGRISFIYIYHFEGRKRRMTLGNYPHMSLSHARKLHREALQTLAQAKDPALEKKKDKLETRTASTVNKLIDEYIELWAKPRKRSWEEDNRILDKDIRPAWGKLKAKDITKRDVILMLECITKRGAPIAANRTLACIRRMFNFGIERDLINANPCAAIKAPSKENRRERHLSADEIKIFWNKLNLAPMSELTKLALKLQLVTAQRKGEIVSAEWCEIDFTTNTWVIPADKAKNGHAHRVPLSKLALDILDQLKEISGDSRWIFPTPQSPLHHLIDMVTPLGEEYKKAIISAKWNDIDLKNLTCFTSVSAQKNGGAKLHTINLPEQSCILFKKMKKKRKKLTYIFPKSMRKGILKYHMTGEAVDHALRRSKDIFNEIDFFSPHSLRATAATHMASMRIPSEVLSRILNHTKKGITEQHYNKYDYDDEKRNALNAWSDKIEKIIKQ